MHTRASTAKSGERRGERALGAATSGDDSERMRVLAGQEDGGARDRGLWGTEVEDEVKEG